MDSAADVNICNDLRFMIDFVEKPTNIEGSIANGISLSCGIIQIRLALKDG